MRKTVPIFSPFYIFVKGYDYKMPKHSKDPLPKFSKSLNPLCFYQQQ